MQLDVRYEDGEPTQIEYHSMIYGLVRFHMDGSTAVIDERWNEVDASNLADGFEQQVYTSDVIEAVKDLPFVESIVTETKPEDPHP